MLSELGNTVIFYVEKDLQIAGWSALSIALIVGCMFGIARGVEEGPSFVIQTECDRISKLEARVTEIERVLSGKDGKGGIKNQITVIRSFLGGDFAKTEKKDAVQ